MSFDIDKIKERTDKLERVREELKNYFVGIDSIIDDFINNIKIWYILPEIQIRPLIVNLWGMTGIGKTDLVRRFVNLIDFNDKFIEIQMDVSNENYFGSKVQDHIENVVDNTSDEGILLLDEMQRFKTIDETGMEIQNSKFSDLWMLLSDGKFESDSKNRRELFEMMFDIIYQMDYDDSDDELEIQSQKVTEDTPINKKGNHGRLKAEKKKIRKFKTWAYSARKLKKLLKLEEDIETIMTWDNEKKLSCIQSGIKSKKVFEGSVYSKFLIIISGNLDEAFSMAKAVDEVDFDADLFHEFSKKINILNIKAALVKRFKAEQIARFGNIHIIYPSLSKSSYYKIIEKKILEINDSIFNKHGIKISVDTSVFDTIYKNGVFPTQGVRPLLSTISSIFENSLPNFIYNSLLCNEKEFFIKHEDGMFISEIGGNKVTCLIPRVIEHLKTQKSADEDAMTAVHEAGHAVMYAILFKTNPTQIICKTSSDDVSGFIGFHDVVYTKQKCIDKIKVCLGGKIAEKIVFKEDFITTGSSADISKATSIASDYVRKNGFGKQKGYVLKSKDADYKEQMKESDKSIEDIVLKSEIATEKMLNENLDFLKEVVENLYNNKELTPQQFSIIARKFVDGFKTTNAEDIIIDGFKEKMFNFIKK